MSFRGICQFVPIILRIVAHTIDHIIEHLRHNHFDLMRLWRLGVLFLLLVGALQTSACPESCSCLNSGYTFQCVQCLQTFYRYYDSISKSCPCMTGFLEKDPADTYCCPTNCSSCSDQGCVRCPVNFMQQYSTSLEVYVCICEDNYYYDESTNSCVCLSHTNSSLYYENVPTDRC